MSTLTAIQKTIDAQKEANAVKLTPNSADTSLTASREVGVLIEGSNATVQNTSDAGSVVIKGGVPNRDSIDGGDITIQGGDGYKGGNILIVGGDNTDNSASSISGAIAIQTGGQDLTSDQHTGNILINTGNVSAVNKSSGSLDIKTGTPHNAQGSSSGGVTIETGGTSNIAHNGSSGNLIMKTGQGGLNASGPIAYSTGDTSSGTTGSITFLSGTSSSGITGDLAFFSGSAGEGGASGDIKLVTGVVTRNGGAIPYNTGDVTVASGTGVGAWANSGTLSLYTGNSARETGDVSLYTGDSSGDNSGTINIYTGSAIGGLGDTSGSIDLTTGDSYFQPGRIKFVTGASTGGSPGGHIQAVTGNVTDVNNTQEGGGIWYTTGTHAGSGDSGLFNISTGDQTGTGNSGYIDIRTGDQTLADLSGKIDIHTGVTTGEDSGEILIKTGFTDATLSSSGEITIATGGPEDVNGFPLFADNTQLANSGGITIRTGSTYDVVSGSLTLQTGITETGTSGSVSLSSGQSTGAGNSGPMQFFSSNAGGDSGWVVIRSGSSTSDGNSGSISLYTGNANTVAPNESGAINISTGVGHLTSGAVSITSGAPFIDTGSTSGGVTIKTGGTANTANAGHSGNIVIGSGQGGTDESGSVSITTGDTSTQRSGALTIGSGTANADWSGDVNISTGGGTGGGDIYISTGLGSDGHISLATDGNGDINLTADDVAVSSTSVPNSVGNDQRLLTVQADGVLKSLGLQVLGHGKISHSIPAVSFLEILPVFFMNKTYNTGVAQDVNLSPNGSTPDNHNEVVEVYEGIRPIDESNSPSFTLDGIDLENLSIHITYHVSANITVYQPHKIGFTVSGAVDGHRNVRLSWNRLISGGAKNANASGIHNDLLADPASIVINYFVLHHTL